MVAPTDGVEDRMLRCTWTSAPCTEDVDLTHRFLQLTCQILAGMDRGESQSIWRKANYLDRICMITLF